MSRKNRTGTTLTAREIRRTYPSLDKSVLYVIDDEETHDHHSEIETPEYTGRPCGCVVTRCPECAPQQFDADGDFTGTRPLWNPRTGDWTA